MLDSLAGSVAGASAEGFLFTVIALVVVALASAWGTYAMLIRKRVLQDTPTALIRSAPQGYVELQGTAEMMDGLPIYAPVSMQACVWYKYKIEEKRRAFGDNSRSEWRTIESATSDNLFYLLDGTGRCAVDPEGAKVTPSSRKVWYGNSRRPGRGGDSNAWFHFTGLSQIGRNFRYTEALIRDGDPMYALGDFKTHGGGGVALDRNAEVGEVLREWKKDNATMLERFDANKDGKIDLEEWETAREAAGQEVDKHHAQVATAPPVDVLCHAKGTRRPFVLAAKTEQEMLAKFHWSAVGLGALASVATIASLWMFGVR